MHKWRRFWPAVLALLLTACGTVAGGEQEGAKFASVPVVDNSSSKATEKAAVEPVNKVPTDPTVAPEWKPEACPVTKPPVKPFVPPEPYPPSAPWSGAFWYGTDDLWTQVATGSWPLRQKVFWWRDGYSWKEDPTPALTVTARRLDAPAPPVRASDATNAYAPDIQSAMLVGVDFPTSGCWEVTGRLGDDELSFVVLVGY